MRPTFHVRTWWTPPGGVAHRIAVVCDLEGLAVCRAVVALRGLRPFVVGDERCVRCFLAAPEEEL